MFGRLSVFVAAAALTFLVVLGVCALRWLRSRAIRERARRRREAARVAFLDGTTRMDRALGAFQGLPWRLECLADGADAAARASRELDRLRVPLGLERRDLANWTTPRELRHDSPRPGDHARWQAFDRAISSALATADDPGLDYASTARACRRMAVTARALAAEVAATPRPHTRHECWFCGQTATQVGRLIAGAHASICDECVELCNEALG